MPAQELSSAAHGPYLSNMYNTYSNMDSRRVPAPNMYRSIHTYIIEYYIRYRGKMFTRVFMCVYFCTPGAVGKANATRHKSTPSELQMPLQDKCSR